MSNFLFQGDTTPYAISREVLSDDHEFTPSDSPLADYVLDEMPQDLENVRSEDVAFSINDLSDKHALILEDLRQQIESNTDADIAKVTQLDLLFMFGCYIPEGEKMFEVAPPEIMALVRQQADRFEGVDPIMTYDLIIDVNSAELRKTGRMRTFFSGDEGKHERDFYLGHTLAEHHVREAAELLKELVERPNHYDPKTIFESVSTDMRSFDRVMKEYGRYPVSSFGLLRPYLASYADGTRNASGAFMPSVQMLEAVLHAPTPMYQQFIDESMPYFPQSAQPTIKSWSEESANGKNIADLIDSGSLTLDQESKSYLIVTIDQFINFRMMHLGITRKQIPEAFDRDAKLSRSAVRAILEEMQITSPEVAGTAGFDVKNVLQNSVVRLFRLLDRIEAIDVA